MKNEAKENLFLRYLAERRDAILTFLAFAAVFAVAFFLYRLPLAAVLYPTLLCAAAGIVLLVLDFFRVRARHRRATLLTEPERARHAPLPTPETLGEADMQAVVAALRASAAAFEDAAAKRYADTIDYYTVWAHQIKTPISSMRLTLGGEDTPLARQLSAELSRIEQYVDMVLTYLRLDMNAGDYVFRTYAVDPLVRAAVKRFSAEFIGRRLRVEFMPSGISAVTDEKWLSFVLEQLLSNALKYTREGGVRIFSPSEKLLCIADTGIGIEKEDLPRVFEKGYTGIGGRGDAHSSGIGLYLCRRICENLGVGLSLDSTVGVGTTATLDFSQYARRGE